ncbi:MAG TPA: chemotaxis response regulator protein-glutamate methylesterase [Bryobacteraceae bacterium]|nr:chemotaxis response regulator protein-glutamate methylesterase [Bryobacteraceae bacterium]
MQPVRVLIVDDSAVVRRLLSEVLAADPELEVVGAAGNGSLALTRIPEVKPDLVTLDIEMPGMDGLATITEIRKRYPKLPVIMFSSLTERGASATLDALARGASDYVTKPTNAGTADAGRQRVREELIPKIKSLCAVREKFIQPLPSPVVAAPRRAPARIDIVAIGASTGGPNALAEVVPQFPADFPVPIVIVQHMPPLFTRLLADRLNRGARLTVQEGQEGGKVESGQVWIAPGDQHMTVTRKGTDIVLALKQDPPENSCRPAVDVLFRSVAETYGANALAVVLTGMGSDGTRGAQVIRAAGGEVMVQDEASSVVWGMPGSVVAASLADRIYPLANIVPEVVRRVTFRRMLASAARAPLAR